MCNDDGSVTMHTNKELLIQRLKQQGYLQSQGVEEAIRKVPRELFIPKELQHAAYVDTPLSIGSGQTISAPHMVVIMCEHLDVQPGQTILEIGSGSGYHAAVLSHLVGPTGKVFSVERIPLLANDATHALKKAKIENVLVILGDGSEGLDEFQPYDRIYVTCAAPSIPDPLLHQLKKDGLLLIPVGSHYCDLIAVTKHNDHVTKKNLGGCAFVPLVGKFGYH